MTMQTIRQQMMEVLLKGEYSARDLSQLLRISEKEVFLHLSHIKMSATAQNKKFHVMPASCLDCGYTFENRRRVTKPGRCPRCKGEHIQSPTYSVS